MPKPNVWMRWFATAAAIIVGSLYVDAASASTYANIVVQGEPAGMEFDDWIGIPVLAMDPIDNPGGTPNPFIDIKDVQVANNEDFLFLRISYHTITSSGTIIAIDNDQNIATGFDVFGLGLIGSEIGYINDFPFAQATGTFNTNVSLTGGPIGNGGALIFPFWDQNGMDKELAIPRDLFVTFPAAPGFPNPSINLAIYTDQGLADITDVISYTFADPPAGLPGDYNDNDTVDAADYVVWRDNDGTSNTLPNDLIGGMIGSAHYDQWRANFGMPDPGAGNGSGLSATIPEPASGLLLWLGTSVLVAFRRRWS